MKSLIRFSSEANSTTLEPKKYLDNLYKAMGEVDISTTSSLLSKAQIAHFISPQEEKQINDAYLEDLIVVISLGYAESDEKNRFFEYKENFKPTLSEKSKRVLKQADLVIVPTETIKSYLLEDEVETPIEVVTTGVDIEQLSSPNIDKQLFLKYMKNRSGRPYVISRGNGDKKSMQSLAKIAKAVPGVDFYYAVDRQDIIESVQIADKTKEKNKLSNLFINYVIPEDVYISGLVGASAYLSLPSCFQDFIGIFEAFGAKTQVVYMDEGKKHSIFQNNENVLIAANEEKAERLIFSLSTTKKRNTINKAYQFALGNSISVMGNQIKKIYEKLLNRRK